MKAIIFAAGLGTRLKPFTLSHPKALVEVGGKPMLQHVIEKLRDAGIIDIIINVHHFANQIVDFLNANNGLGCKITISDETDMLLETGGGIAKAAPMLEGTDHFVAYNADILSDFDIRAMVDAHTASRADVTLLTSSRPSSRQLYFNTRNRLCGWQNLNTGECRPDGFAPGNEVNAASFNGIHVISRRVLHLLTEVAKNTPKFSITPFYVDNCRRLDIRSYRPEDAYQWHDIGRAETLEAARACWGKH